MPRPDGGALPGDAVLVRADVMAAGRQIVTRALTEDLGVAGDVTQVVDADVTTVATVPPEMTGQADLVARQDGVVAGCWLVGEVYDRLDGRVGVELAVQDGDRVASGQVLGNVAGPLRSILVGERTALNLVGHLSGIATATARFVDEVAGTACVVRDTRKTIPGMRLLEKAAVSAAGGVNHRIGLFDALLVKDNHVAAAGGIGAATRAAIAAGGDHHVQVEVDSLEQLEAAVTAGARDLLLDNFDPDAARAAVARIRDLEREHGRILVEASGAIRLETVRAFALAGVDRVAVGAITHSAPQFDVALDVRGARPVRDLEG